MTWQFYWKAWHLGFCKEYDEDFKLYDCFLFIGPLQLHWYGSK